MNVIISCQKSYDFKMPNVDLSIVNESNFNIVNYMRFRFRPNVYITPHES